MHAMAQMYIWEENNACQTTENPHFFFISVSSHPLFIYRFIVCEIDWEIRKEYPFLYLSLSISNKLEKAYFLFVAFLNDTFNYNYRNSCQLVVCCFYVECRSICMMMKVHCIRKMMKAQKYFIIYFLCDVNGNDGWVFFINWSEAAKRGMKNANYEYNKENQRKFSKLKGTREVNGNEWMRKNQTLSCTSWFLILIERRKKEEVANLLH